MFYSNKKEKRRSTAVRSHPSSIVSVAMHSKKVSVPAGVGAQSPLINSFRARRRGERQGSIPCVGKSPWSRGHGLKPHPMIGERGMGYVADMLVFALMISFASALLVKANPVDMKAVDDRYTANFADSTLLALQNATANELGGLRYELGFSDFTLNLPILSGSAGRDLGHKTLMQLLVEDALCNLRIELAGVDVNLVKLSQDMDAKVQALLRGALDHLTGGLFNYRLTARTKPIDASPVAKVWFETKVESSSENQQRTFSKTITMAMPISWQDLLSRCQEVHHINLSSLGLEPNVTVEITLELWSR